MSNRTCAVLQTLRDMGFPDDLAFKIRRERAALTIQSFYRRSLWRVESSTEVYGFRVMHRPPIEIQRPYYKLWNPRHTQHGSAESANNIYSQPIRRLVSRYKPLGIMLKAMMKEIIERMKEFNEIKRRCPKRKKLFWRVTLVRRTKFLGDLPIITVYNKMA